MALLHHPLLLYLVPLLRLSQPNQSKNRADPWNKVFVRVELSSLGSSEVRLSKGNCLGWFRWNWCHIRQRNGWGAIWSQGSSVEINNRFYTWFWRGLHSNCKEARHQGVATCSRSTEEHWIDIGENQALLQQDQRECFDVWYFGVDIFGGWIPDQCLPIGEWIIPLFESWSIGCRYFSTPWSVLFGGECCTTLSGQIKSNTNWT